MSLVIPNEFLQTAHISEVDLKLEIAILTTNLFPRSTSFA